MAMSKPVRWTLIALFGLLMVSVAPMALFMVSNFAIAMFSLMFERQPTATELVGNYRLSAPWGESTLQIMPNGTFQQEIIERDNAKRSVVGRWDSQGNSNSLTVDFQPFGMVWDDDHERTTSYSGMTFYRNRWGRTYGIVDDDLGERYERQREKYGR